MPLSSLHDPVDVARAHGALEAAWTELSAAVPPDDHDRERTRLAYIVAAFSSVAASERDLVDRAIKRFRQKAGTS